MGKQSMVIAFLLVSSVLGAVVGAGLLLLGYSWWAALIGYAVSGALTLVGLAVRSFLPARTTQPSADETHGAPIAVTTNTKRS